MADFALNADFDLQVEGGVFAEQKSYEGTIMCSMHTDGRVAGRRGYWCDMIQSELWIFEQKRVSGADLAELDSCLKKVAKAMVREGVFGDMDVEVMMDEGVPATKVRCYDASGLLVVERKFTV